MEGYELWFGTSSDVAIAAEDGCFRNSVSVFIFWVDKILRHELWYQFLSFV
jgi:hypothetical protein